MRKIKLGDIFEIKTSKGKGYLHYIYTDLKIGRELVRVLPGLYAERPLSFDNLAVQKERYLIFFTISAAAKRKIIEPVGHYPADSFTMPKYMRTEHSIRGEFLGWHIIDTNTWHRELVKELTSEQTQLSDWANWNDTLLIERLVSGWSLESWV